MRLYAEFDISADIIDVPQKVIDNRKQISAQFLKWLFTPEVKAKYTVINNGRRALCYRSEAFVEFLNQEILSDFPQKAKILEQYVSLNNQDKLPAVCF